MEVIVASVKLNDFELNICNIYLPNQHKFKKNDIENIIRQISSPFIITGDFNSHNIIWGSKKTDNRGKEIEKILDDEILTLLNNQKPTRINPSNGEFSNIDLTFANTNLSQRLEWKVLPNITSSAHFPHNNPNHPKI